MNTHVIFSSEKKCVFCAVGINSSSNWDFLVSVNDENAVSVSARVISCLFNSSSISAANVKCQLHESYVGAERERKAVSILKICLVKQH
jgi:hypothetical protein